MHSGTAGQTSTAGHAPPVSDTPGHPGAPDRLGRQRTAPKGGRRTFRDRWFKWMRRVPYLGNRKIFLACAVYMTPKKLWNILRCELELRRRVLKPKSHPYIAVLDVTNACNLRCPFCPTGTHQASGRKLSMMTPEFVEHLLEHVGDYLVMVYLYNWGEPLLNKDIAEIVRVCHDRGIFTSLSTNLSVKHTDRLEGMCDAGLDHIDPSIDGATQEVYQEYRKEGKIDLVYSNIRHLLAYRESRDRVNPVIDWQYLDFDHNRHEIEAARKKAQELGVDRFFTRHGYTPDDGEEEWIESRGDQDKGAMRTPKYSCELLWRHVVVNADGGVAPCCYMYRKEHDFGQVGEESLEEIRNNETYVMARKLFDVRLKDEIPDDLRHPCLVCEVAHQKPHLRQLVEFNKRQHAEVTAAERPTDGTFFYER